MDEPQDPVSVLRRWEESGGAWEVLSAAGGRLTLALLRCDGGEEVDRFSTSSPTLPAFLAGRRTSEDQPRL